VTVDQAHAIVQAVRQEHGVSSPLFAGVFVDASPDEINAVASAVGLDLVQLNGGEDPASFHEIAAPVIRAVGPPLDSLAEDVLRGIETQRIDPETPALFLLDAYDPVNHGGSGRRADWVLASEVAQRTPLMLAGGLSPENVGEAIVIAGPFGVDVSSGVERDGVKDPQRIRDFIARARQEFVEKLAATPQSGHEII